MAHRDLPAAQRIMLYLVALGFAFGAATHALDFVHFGWWPYRFGPPSLNLFWNALVALDAAIVVLIVTGRRMAGLALASVVMIADVAANTYAWLELGFSAFVVSVPLQSAFLGFVLITAIVARRHRSSHLT
jgi:hypothetical protein